MMHSDATASYVPLDFKYSELTLKILTKHIQTANLNKKAEKVEK